MESGSCFTPAKPTWATDTREAAEGSVITDELLLNFI